MPSPLDNELNEQFYAWEWRGRGRVLADGPVELEPPFRPFYGHFLKDGPIIDDGRQHTAISGLIERWFGKKSEKEAVPEEAEPEAVPLFREEPVELAVFFPGTAHFKNEAMAAVLASLPHLTEPLSFEVFGNSRGINLAFTASVSDLPRVRPLLTAQFAAATFQCPPNQLATAWTSSEEKAVLEFGLGYEFMMPLATKPADVLPTLCGILHGLPEDQMGLYQVLFQQVRHRWSESVIRSTSHSDGRPFFVNAPELASASERKVSAPLFSTVVRLASGAPNVDRAWEAVAALSGALRAFQNPAGNELVPLQNEGYPHEEHTADVITRQSRRHGMLLNLDELIGFVHLPGCPISALTSGRRNSKAAPSGRIQAGGLVLGINEHLGETRPVVLDEEQRFRHVHIIGATGTGKSTLLFNMVRQDVEHGRGVAVLDPHGDLITRILGIIPESRRDDVIVFDPSDPDYVIGFNLLSAHSDAEKALLASDLVSVFQRHSTSWGDQMNSVLRNAVLAFLESGRGGTLLDLRRFLLEPKFREEFLTTVTDPEITYYWAKAFGQLAGNKSLGPILTRLDTFLAPKSIRHTLAMQHAKFDFGDVMATGKIFLAKLPQGLIGKSDSYLLGSLLIGKFQQLAMARQGLTETQRRPYHLIIDEFHHFMTPSMAEILNGARKYRLSLTLAHHEIHQLAADKEVESALLSNAGTRIVFRVGEADARQLADGFAAFESGDISKLEKGQAICRIERSEQDFNMTVELPLSGSEDQALTSANDVLAKSRRRFATPRFEVQALLRQQLSVSKTHPVDAGVVTEKALPASPKVTAPETQVPSAPPPPAKARVASPVDPEGSQIAGTSVKAVETAQMGRGGAQHQDFQRKLREAAQNLGFHVTVEKPTPDKSGSVDLALERDGMTIACEISVTTSANHEAQNARKCLEAGYDHVVLISPDSSRLGDLRAATSNLAEGWPGRLQWLSPTQFHEWLLSLAKPPQKAGLTEAGRVRRGFKVRSKLSDNTSDERRAKEAETIEVISKSIKTKRPSPHLTKKAEATS